MLEKLPEAVGLALRGQRAGIDETLYHRVHATERMGALLVCSPAFADQGPMPSLYTADGDGRSPPLHWIGVPDGARELVVLVEDADAPTPKPLVHAIVTGLPGQDGVLSEGAISAGADDAATDGIDIGRNSLLRRSWLPPDPPPGHGPHRYIFQVFALGDGDPLPQAPGRSDVEAAVRQRALAGGRLVAVYERPDGTVRAGLPVDVAA